MASNSNRTRQLARQRVQRFYKLDEIGLGGACVYCGMKAAGTLDHVPPLSRASEMDLEYLKFLGPKLFPACHNCNSVLGDTHELLLVDRRDIVSEYLQRRKKRMLARGKDIYEKKLPIFYTSDFLCLQVFERWLFATLTTAEATPEPEPEEEYVRRFFPKKKQLRTKVSLSSAVYPLTKTDSIFDLAYVDPFKITESDLKRVVPGSINLTVSEIDFVIDRLKNLPISEARDECVLKFRPFLNKHITFLKADGGTRFFLSIMFSVNCKVEPRREILAELIRVLSD